MSKISKKVMLFSQGLISVSLLIIAMCMVKLSFQC